MSSNRGNVLALFAGVGGLELGLGHSGFHPRLFCEIEEGAQAVLRKRFPGVSLVADIKDIKSVPAGVRVITAGFPCQDLSSSGMKVGINGDRSFLVDEVFRLLGTTDKLDWVLLENVKFMLHLNKGSAMTYITSKLRSLGYNWAYRVVNTEGFGLPQRRHRVYIVASKKHDPRGVLLVDDHAKKPNNYDGDDGVPRGFYWTEGRYSTGMSYNGIPPLKAGSTIGIPSPPAILFPSGFAGTPDIRDAERLQGFRGNWTKPAESVSRPSHRWKLIGNSVSVPVAKWIGGRLKSPLDYIDKGDEKLQGGEKWPHAAWCMGGEIRKSTASEWPIRKKFKGIDEFLKYPLKPLSVKASNGYLSRAEKGNLAHPPNFIENLKGHLKQESRDTINE